MIATLRELHCALPSQELLGRGDRVEEQARAVLRLVLAPILVADFQPGAPESTVPSNCPNCQQPSSATRSPYCGTDCRNVASFIRQFRGAVEERSIFEAERQEGIGQVFWYLVGGGRPLRQHIIPERTRKDLLKKSGGICAVCGEPATTIDHIASGCNRPINLQAVCDNCCKTKPFGDPSIVNTHHYKTRLEEFALRMGSPTVIRCCDDPKLWDWRAYLKAREALARAC